MEIKFCKDIQSKREKEFVCYGKKEKSTVKEPALLLLHNMFTVFRIPKPYRL